MMIKKKIDTLFVKSEQRKILFIFFGIVVMAFLEVVGISLIAPFIAIISTPEIIHENQYLSFVYKFLDIGNDNDFISFLGVVVVVMLLISNSYQAFMTWKITYFIQMQTQRLSVRLLQQYLLQPYSFFLNKNTSELSKNILFEVAKSLGGVVLQGIMVCSKIIMGLFIIILLLVVDPIIAIVASVVLGGFYWFIYFIVRRRLRRIGIASTKATFNTYKSVNEALSGIKDIKLRASEKEFLKRFYIPSKELANYSAQHTLISALPRYLLEVIAFGGIAIIAIATLSAEKSNGETISIIALYALAGYRLMPALQQIYSGITGIRYTLPSLEILIDDLMRTTGKTNTQSAVQKLNFKKYFQIKDLDFSYPGSDRRVLKKLNLTIKANTTVGIVGTTGSGKTTLIDILLGLLMPEAGTVIVDGVKVNGENLPKWQEKIGYVPQVIYLTDDTIENNIAFAVPEEKISIERVKKVSKMVKLNNLINDLPSKYKTFVGERGVRLSGGQQQRIGIARALYLEPSVLVLDEATSSLDGITEGAIMDALSGLSHKKTIIMIAHRLSTIKECDIIHLIDDGCVKDSGTYQELMDKSSEFRKMAKLSF